MFQEPLFTQMVLGLGRCDFLTATQRLKEFVKALRHLAELLSKKCRAAAPRLNKPYLPSIKSTILCKSSRPANSIMILPLPLTP